MRVRPSASKTLAPKKEPAALASHSFAVTGSATYFVVYVLSLRAAATRRTSQDAYSHNTAPSPHTPRTP